MSESCKGHILPATSFFVLLLRKSTKRNLRPDTLVLASLFKLNYLKSFIMTSLTRLRLILVNVSGLMKKKNTFGTKYPFL